VDDQAAHGAACAASDSVGNRRLKADADAANDTDEDGKQLFSHEEPSF